MWRTALLGDGEAGGLAMDDDPDTGDFFWTGVREDEWEDSISIMSSSFMVRGRG